MKTIVHSLAETKLLAECIAKRIEPGMLLTLSGDLGAGKTTFTKYLGAALGVKKTINSPTFTILKVYYGRMPLYRISALKNTTTVTAFVSLNGPHSWKISFQTTVWIYV